MEMRRSKEEKFTPKFTLEKSEFFEHKWTNVEDSIIVEKANRCMDQCKQPVDVLKRILGSNLKEVTINI